MTFDVTFLIFEKPFLALNLLAKNESSLFLTYEPVLLELFLDKPNYFTSEVALNPGD